MPIKTFTLDPNNPPRLSQQAKDYYDNLDDSDIDYSEIPDMGDLNWDTLRVDKPGQAKPAVTIRVEQDVLDYYKSEMPQGFTGYMASVLKSYAEAQKGHS